MDEDNMTRSEEQQLSLQKALQQCELVQNMIDISISNLEGLRTKCAASNDLTQKEIRTLESKLVKYFSRQLSCKRKVALQERNAKLEGFPQLLHWFRIVDIRKEVMEEIAPGQLSLEELLDMTDEQVCATVEKFGANREECARLNASLSCLRSVHKSGESGALGPAPGPLQPGDGGDTLSVPRWSPQIPRRDLGNSIKHRFSTKYWMSQTCTVCGKGMLFGLKCKNCKLKCHNKCTKEAPPCHLLIIHRGGRRPVRGEADLHCKPLPPTLPPPPFLFRFPTARARLVRTESVPCDINNPLRKPPRYSDLHVSQTLPKTNKLNKDHIPVPYQPDSSSNPSSTTSSTPSSPAPPLPPSATPPSPLHPSPQCPRQQKQFNLPAPHYYKCKQQFIFPDVVPETPTRAPQVVLHPVNSNPILEGNPLLQIEVEPTSENEEVPEEAQESEDDFEEMNLSLLSARNFPRKASQTSIFLQEWDIPFEQLEMGELIGKGRFGQVFHGRWHGEVAIRLIDIERDNEDQLKAFKREVMAYRQTRHENVVLFMGACMSPPHLAIITSLCKGRTLYSVVRDAKIVLDVNKTRQIAQEIVKGMGYLHAKGILHKDLKSKNVFYDNGKVVITDFGLFSISGVLQAGRRENKLRIQNGWLCHLAPEIIRQLSPDTEEDKLPFSKHSDVFALGTIWYELHAREWPFKTQPAEAIIWQVGRGMKPNLSQIGMGKEISDILLFCWAYEQEERPTFTKLMDMLEKLPKRNRRLSHPGHFWKSAE
ncbi:kinase suppressor of Ras 2 [Heliangelus exortis]|uniref:kinase suppressor of Ras 2 n=1 Tax=Heliangelus exortis TaxID=472823 RepID=UPI003A8F42AD